MPSTSSLFKFGRDVWFECFNMDKTDDKTLIRNLWKECPERFVALCQMHLSFHLDLSVEALGAICNEKLQQLPKLSVGFAEPKEKSKATPTARLLPKQIAALSELIEYLGRDSNIRQEGLFRKCGKRSRQQDLYECIISDRPLDLSRNVFSVHDCACALKKFLAELPEPLFTNAQYLSHLQIAELCKDTFPLEEHRKMAIKARQIEATQLMFILLPSDNQRVLKMLLDLLHRVSREQCGNKMTAPNLATMFAPHLLGPRQMSPRELCAETSQMVKAVAFMIENQPKLFEIPLALRRDLVALSKVQQKEKRKTANSPAEGGSDEEAVHTTITFCDRQKSENLSCQDTTTVALAELYAYVQTMPDSAKKKHFLKRFNKENGPGQRNHQRSKSLKKAFKKHFLGKHISEGASSQDSGQVSSPVVAVNMRETLRLVHPSQKLRKEEVVTLSCVSTV